MLRAHVHMCVCADMGLCEWGGGEAWYTYVDGGGVGYCVAFVAFTCKVVDPALVIRSQSHPKFNVLS